jgi:nucleoid-associated protein EbfC
MSKALQKLMKQAQQMQAQVARAQEKLKTTEVEGTAGGGMVKVVMNGNQEVVSLKIDKQAVDPNDVEMLEDLVMAAFKNAQERVAELTNSALGGLSSGLNLPGL